MAIPDTAPIVYRTHRRLQHKMQAGTILSLTTIVHHPTGFGVKPRSVGLIRLDDGSRICGQLILPDPHADSRALIGCRVQPCLRLHRVNEQGLRIYDVAYDVLSGVRDADAPFPGYILALTGPSGVGKTTISEALTRIASQYAERVPIVTTRVPAASDNEEYVHVTDGEFHAMETAGKLAAITQIASTAEDRRYGYRSADIERIWQERKIPVVVTEMHLLQGLAARYGRRAILSCGLLPPGRSRRMMLSCLLHRLRTRGRDSAESIADRMKNAEGDLALLHSRGELFDHMIVNDDLDTVVSTLQGHMMELQKI